MKQSVLDIETTGEPFVGRILCVGWRGKAYTPDSDDWDALLADLADDSWGKVVFTKYDHRWLRLYGIDVQGPVIDVQAMAWAVNERTPLDLEWCARHYCGIVMDKRIFQRANVIMFTCDDGTEVPLDEAPLDQVCTYNVRDLEATDALFMELRRRLAFEELAVYYEHDVLPFTPVLLDMECRGVPVDVQRAKELRDELSDEMDHLEFALYDEGNLPRDFKLGSSQQLGKFMFQREFTLPTRRAIDHETRADLLKFDEIWGIYGEYEGMTVERVGREYAHGHITVKGLGLRARGKTDKGRPSTDAPTLRVYYGDHPWVEKYLALAQRRTIVNTFLRTIEEQSVNGRLYGRFNQTGTKTGRLSSSGPNLQNMPSRGVLGRRVRELFVPGPGMSFVHGDYSQLEPRLMAHFSGDPVLRDIYEDGLDIYLETARRVFGCSLEEAKQYRNAMKTYVLALGYGSGAKTLRRQLAEAGQTFSPSEVESTLSSLKSVYSVFFDWKESVISDAMNEGYVETLSGHRRHFGGRSDSWKSAGQDERQAVNAVIQGSAADIVARAMMLVDQIDGLGIVAQVHDELLIECEESTSVDLAVVQSACEQGHGFALDVPLSFEPRYISSWAEGKD